MMIQDTAEKIGQYNYAHWTGRPITPQCHEVAYVPQSIADGWEAYCSCGQWRGFLSLYETPGRDETIAALKAEFDKHALSAGQEAR